MDSRCGKSELGSSQVVIIWHYFIIRPLKATLKNCIANSAVQQSTHAFPATKCVSSFSPQENKKERDVVKSSLYRIYIHLFIPILANHLCFYYVHIMLHIFSSLFLSILSISFKTNSILLLPLCPLHFSIYLFFIWSSVSNSSNSFYITKLPQHTSFVLISYFCILPTFILYPLILGLISFCLITNTP